jgi:hypothetical protein
MGDKSSAPAAPDYTSLVSSDEAAATTQAQTSADQLAWAKQQYASDSATTGKVVASDLQDQQTSDANATKDRAEYDTVYQPLENQYASEAANWNSTERQNTQAGAAVSDVAQQYAAARTSSAAALESYGVDPSTTRAQALDVGTRTAQAAASAAAATTARNTSVNEGLAMQQNAIATGNTYSAKIAADQSAANTAGNSAVNNTLNTTASGANTMGTASTWAGLANESNSSAANTLTQGYDASLGQYNADTASSNSLWSGIGSLTGAIAGGSVGRWAARKVTSLAEGGVVAQQAVPLPGPDQTGAPTQAVPDGASPSNGQAVDDVHADLTAGEIVIPKDVASWKGEEFFQKLAVKSRADMGRPARPMGRPGGRPTALPVGQGAQPAQAIAA